MQKLLSDHKLKTSILLLIASVMLTITVTRAAITQITYDEAYTYMAYVQEIHFSDFDTFRYVYNESAANNHWLNTVLIAAVEKLLGVSYCEFAIRLPNLIAFVIYCVYVCISYKKRMISFICVSFLLLNYYLNEFYGLARGYAMAQTFVFIATFYYMCWKESIYQRHQYLILCSISLMIGTYANTIVLLIIPAFGILWLWRLISEKQIWPFLKKWAWFVILFILSSVFMLRYHFKISAPDMPLFTGNKGFYHSVVLSYLNMITSNPVLTPILFAAFCAFSFFSIAILKKDVINCDLMFSLACFVLTNILMNTLFQKGYITERVAIPFYGYIVFAVYELWNAAWKRIDWKGLKGEQKKTLHIAASVLIVCVLGFHYLQVLSFSDTTDWKHNYGRRERLLAGYITTGSFPALEDPVQNSKNDQFYRIKYWYIANTFS